LKIFHEKNFVGKNYYKLEEIISRKIRPAVGINWDEIVPSYFFYHYIIFDQ